MLTWQAARAAMNRAAVAPALVAGLLLVGCSHASTTAPGSVAARGGGATTAAAAAPARTKGSVTQGAAAFCSFLTSVNKVAQATSQQQGMQLLASILPRLKAQQAAAPAPVAADFGIVVTAAEQAVAQGNLSPLATNQVAAAGTKLTSYCHSRS